MHRLVSGIVQKRSGVALDEGQLKVSLLWAIFDHAHAVEDTEHAEESRFGRIAPPEPR
jgi:hypothetical protein